MKVKYCISTALIHKIRALEKLFADKKALKKTSASLLVASLALLAFSLPVQAGDTDSRIELSAKKSHVFKTYLKSDDIKVYSKDGDVVLTGVVSENFHKSLAVDTVSGLPGVKSVEDRLEVKGAPPSRNSDAWIRDKVKVTLLFHRSVSAGTTTVDVKDGIVTLQGDASRQAQKELTTEYTRDVEGVKDVHNEMTLTKRHEKSRSVGEKIDDASITAQVKMTLLYHRSTSALNTRVETNRGVVTLDGKAGTAAEMKLATRLAIDVDGVSDVKNRMTIE
ncbi:MAG: BON domain-containing protein [Desulfuromonadales bacterium]